jgi:anthranilate synthase/aminodeoxychorismate synthase-like glutamine amidotransferase
MTADDKRPDASLSVLLIDNFDSFSFNLVDELDKRGACVDVWRNDIDAGKALALVEAMPAPRLVVISPGPGAPADAGCSLELVRAACGRVPVFGVCLGHQAIVEAFGGEVGYAGQVVHGKAARITHDGEGLLASLPSPFYAARYHSLAASRMPDVLRVTATVGDVVMAVEHRSEPVAGVQFHPESILTPFGGALLAAVMRWASDWHAAKEAK